MKGRERERSPPSRFEAPQADAACIFLATCTSFSERLSFMNGPAVLVAWGRCGACLLAVVPSDVRENFARDVFIKIPRQILEVIRKASPRIWKCGGLAKRGCCKGVRMAGKRWHGRFQPSFNHARKKQSRAIAEEIKKLNGYFYDNLETSCRRYVSGETRWTKNRSIRKNKYTRKWIRCNEVLTITRYFWQV